MKTCLFVLLVLLSANVRAADLTTTTIEHLYYLQTRADHVRKFKPDEMVEYCIAQKIGGVSFDSLCSQLVPLRVELARLLEIEKQQDAEPHVEELKKRIELYSSLLREEAQKVQNGMICEGQIAADTLQVIARAQQNSR